MGGKLGHFEGKSVNIAFSSTTLIYISLFRIGIEFCTFLDYKWIALSSFQWLGPENAKIGQKLARIWTQTLVPGLCLFWRSWCIGMLYAFKHSRCTH